MLYPIIVLVVLVIMFLVASIRILNEYERAVIFRLGRIIPTKGPGLIILIPVVDRMVRVDTRTITMDVPSQDVITRDNVSIKVNAFPFPPRPAWPWPAACRAAGRCTSPPHGSP